MNNELVLKHIFEQISTANTPIDDGLFTGRSGQIIFLYHLSEITKNKQAKQLADTLLGEMYNSIKSKGKSSFPNFDNGLAGIGWCQEYLVNKNFCEGNTDDVLKDVDSIIFKILNEVEDIPFNLNGLIGYLIYCTSRLYNKKSVNITTKINQELLIRIINKIDLVAPNLFLHIGKECSFDLFWSLPVLLLTLNKALDLNVHNEKIFVMIDQWMYYLNTHLPGIHSHRLSLALSLFHMNKKLNRKDVDKLIHLLLFSVDFDIFYKEVNPYVFNIQYGWYGIVLLLHHAKKIFNSEHPHYNMLEQFRLKIIDICKTSSEEEIISGFKTHYEKKLTINFGLANGLSGIGLLYLLYPEIGRAHV